MMPGRGFARRGASAFARSLLLVALVGGALIAVPATASAHARLRKSDPAANARLAVAPQMIRLWFTEAPELSLTSVTLTDVSGALVVVSAAARDADGELAVRVAITGSMLPGHYTVKWRTAAADGHPSSGTFGFDVMPAATGAPVGASSAPTATVSPMPDSGTVPTIPVAVIPTSDQPSDADALTPAWVIARAVSFVTLLVVLGAVAFRSAVLPRTGVLTAEERSTVAAETARHAALWSVTLLLASAAKLYLQNRMMSGTAAADLAHMRSMSMETHWGAAWRLQFGAGVVALIAFAMASRRMAGGWFVAGVACVTLALSAALAGHAGAATSLRSFAIADDTLHIVGASAWLGSLFWMLSHVVRTHRTVDDRSATRVASLVTAFSPLALGSAAIVVLTGLASAWLRLGSVPALWSTSYGQVLIVKLFFLSGVTATGFYNWRFVQPSLGTAAGTARLRRSGTSELVIGLVVIVVTAVLVAMPTPALTLR
jgi:copper transport protein